MTATPDRLDLCAKCEACNRKLYNCPYCTHSFVYEYRNTIVNKHKGFTEVLYYKKEFSVPTRKNDKNVDRSPKWEYVYKNGKEILTAKKDDVKIKDLLRGLEKSRKRSQDSFFGYAFNNTWDYFFTLTLDPKKVFRENEDAVKYAWKLFRQKMQYLFPFIKILVVIEKHKESDGLHFHGLLGECNLDNVLVPAIYNNKFIPDTNLPNPLYLKPVLSKFGDPIWNFNNLFYTYGYTTVVKLNDDSNNEKMVQYMQKYMTKEQAATKYHKRSYFRTQNLEYKDKFVIYCDELLVRGLLSGENVTIKKENDNMIVAILRN